MFHILTERSIICLPFLISKFTILLVFILIFLLVMSELHVKFSFLLSHKSVYEEACLSNCWTRFLYAVQHQALAEAYSRFHHIKRKLKISNAIITLVHVIREELATILSRCWNKLTLGLVHVTFCQLLRFRCWLHKTDGFI